eukprot:715336-Pelagomonas_calceolata.AAC.1
MLQLSCPHRQASLFMLQLSCPRRQDEHAIFKCIRPQICSLRISGPLLLIYLILLSNKLSCYSSPRSSVWGVPTWRIEVRILGRTGAHKNYFAVFHAYAFPVTTFE